MGLLRVQELPGERVSKIQTGQRGPYEDTFKRWWENLTKR